HDGNVAECTADNIFIVRAGGVYTPMITDGILEGVTRETIIQLCASAGIPCFERTLQRHDLYIADECFLTGTGAEVVPVTKIDGRSVGNGTPGTLTKNQIEGFQTW